jgi:hypothetical protein
MKRKSKSDIALDIIFGIAGAIVFAMLVATLYMMMGFSI